MANNFTDKNYYVKNYYAIMSVSGNGTIKKIFLSEMLSTSLFGVDQCSWYSNQRRASKEEPTNFFKEIMNIQIISLYERSKVARDVYLNA